MTSIDTSHHAEDNAEIVGEREAARRRLSARRDFSRHLLAYFLINAFLVGVWALGGMGYFWPAWVIGAWGVGLIMHAWNVFLRRPLTEADIDAELQRRRR